MPSVARYCCCGCVEGSSCVACTDISPAQYKATFSGVSLCAGCDNSSVGTVSSFKYRWATGFSNASINTTHTLGQTGCQWFTSLTNAMIVDAWPAAGCVGAPLSSTTVNVDIALDRLLSTWRLFIQIGSGSGAQDKRIFDDTSPEVSAGECATVPSFSNSPSACFSTFTIGITTYTLVGSGGSATVVCV